MTRLRRESRDVRAVMFERFRSALEGEAATWRDVPFADYADRPIEFALEAMRVDVLTDEQRAILISVRDEAETNVAAAHAVGKTFVAALALHWWVFAVGGLVVTTAPRLKQVRDLLWREVRTLWKRNRRRLGGHVDLMQLKLGGELVAWGFTASEYAEEGMGGRHDALLLFIQDEASGISQAVDDGVTSNLTDYRNRLLRIGNPLADGTPFAKSCARRLIKVPVWSHPNVAWAYHRPEPELVPGRSADFDDGAGAYVLRPEVARWILRPDGSVRSRDEWPKGLDCGTFIPGGPSIEWVEARRSEADRRPGTPYWVARLDAEFPEDVARAIVPRSWFDAARLRYDADPERLDELASRHDWSHGLDVGDGGDPHALVSRRGPVVYAAREITTLGDRQDVARAQGEARLALEERPGSIAVDPIGVGSGVLAGLLESELPAYGVNFGVGVASETEHLNVRSESYWAVREAFRTEAIAIAPLGAAIEERLREELTRCEWDSPTSAGKLRLRPKDAIKRVLGRSPNLADALALTYGRSTGPHVFFEEIVEEGFVL